MDDRYADLLQEIGFPNCGSSIYNLFKAVFTYVMLELEVTGKVVREGKLQVGWKTYEHKLAQKSEKKLKENSRNLE